MFRSILNSRMLLYMLCIRLCTVNTVMSCLQECPIDQLYNERITIPRGRACPPHYTNRSPTECKRIVPVASHQDILRCCTDANIWTQSPENIIVKNRCGPGMCPNGTSCASYMLDACSRNWTGECDTYLDNIRDVCNPKAREMMRRLSVTVFDRPGSTDHPNADLERALRKNCNEFPGACDVGLTRMCSNFTREDLLRDEKLRGLCGCFLPTSQYPYGNVFNPSCDLLCTSSAGEGLPIQRGFNSSSDPRIAAWVPKRCAQNICLIDNVNMNFVNSVGEGVNFRTVCGECGGKGGSGGACQCYISNIDINTINTQLKNGGIDIEQNCGRCFTDGVGGRRVEIDCKARSQERESGTVEPDRSKVNRGKAVNQPFNLSIPTPIVDLMNDEESEETLYVYGSERSEQSERSERSTKSSKFNVKIILIVVVCLLIVGLILFLVMRKKRSQSLRE